jgi:hypothetical protein
MLLKLQMLFGSSGGLPAAVSATAKRRYALR